MVLEFIFSVLYLFSDFFYWAKLAASIIALRLWKRLRSNRFDLYDFTVKNQPEKLTVLVPNEEKILESPFPEEYLQKAADEIFIYGVNTKSQSLVVRVSRAPNDEAEAWIYLKVQDGRWYELQDTTGYQRNYGGKCTSFTCGGLQMHYLTPMRRWRITYCGMLREGVKGKEKKETNEVFVKFAFLWSASSDVFDPSYEFDIRSTAEAMAGANWKSPIPPVKKISEHLNFYYQSGVIDGIVSVEDQPDVEMYLYGERIRYLGKFCAAVGCKFKHILGVTPKSGLVVHLGKASVPNIFHNLPFGFIVHPDGMNRMIEDGTIISRMSGKNESGEELTATFRAGRQYELSGRFVGDGVRFTSENSWNGHLEMVGIEFEVDGIQGSGFMIYGEIVKLPERKPQSIPPSLSCAAAPLTVAFTDEASHSPELTGGKGSSLGVLTKLSDLMKSQFVVPKGIIVTTAAYKEFLSADVIHKIENLKDIAYGNIPGNIHEACKIVSSAIEQSYLPDKITKEIEDKLSKICVGNFNQQKFAVRSSATGEDTDQMSAAGQMDTFLGVKGLKEIFTAVKKCWASQFGYIATEYKRQNGQILNSPMAVVIQQMVDCEAAGVLFTCDPVTNNPSTVFITGNYGLGESVVSGSEEPDTVVLKKLSSNEVEIKSVTIGLKQHRTVMSDTNTEDEETVVTVDVPEDKRRECCISEDMAIRLGNLSLKIENHFKSPRDIEWGIKDNVIHILQSRPITTGVAVSDYEIKHEFDGPIRCEGDFFSIANVGEVLPGATSPLGMDVFSTSLTMTFQQKEMKERQKNTFQQHLYFPSGFTVPFYNHMTMTVVDLITRVADLESTASQSMMVAFFGRIIDDPELKVIAKYREAGEKKNNLKYYFITIKNLLFSGIGVEGLREKTFSYNMPVKKGKTSKEIFDIITNSCSHNTEPILTHILNTEMSSMWNMYLLSLLGNTKGSIDADVYSDFARLLSSMSNVESADVPSAMQELAQEIAKDSNCEAFRSMTLEDAQKWLETSPTISGYRFRKFIKRHGHRCIKEFDIHSDPWGVDPKPLIKLLKNMLDSCQSTKEKKVENFSEMLSQMKVPLNLKDKIILKFLLPQCRRGVRMRENCKSTMIKSMDNIRKGYKHLSKAMVSEGYLPDRDLLFFLNVNEIGELLETRNPGLISRANHRRKLFPTLDSYIFPETWRGRPIPVNESQDEVDYVADLTMKGIPVSQGCVKGYARIALTMEEASHLKPGEILITHCTDIGWSPYFPIIAGVVTELGGLISHGAVVSREYGLPCVVGLHGATKMFRTGDYVLVDGNKGILQRLTPPE